MSQVPHESASESSVGTQTGPPVREGEMGECSMSNKIGKHLEDNGWRRYQRGDGCYWCKYYGGVPTCHYNNDREGIQVMIEKCRRDINGDIQESYEICIYGQKPDGYWVKFMFYTFKDELIEVMDSQIKQLLAAWTAVATVKDT